MKDVIEIRIYSEEFKDEIIDLIVGIQQREFSIPITAADQPDLSNIPGFYQTNRGNFWIALYNGKIVGTIALINIGNNQAALRKMFVDRDFRGSRFTTAPLLLKGLFDWAYENNFKEIYLGTTPAFLAAHRFYEKHGFIKIDRSALPREFPVMKVDQIFYKYNL